MSRGPTFLEFFAGGGMARAGLGWTPLFANDFDAAKADAYAANWGERPRVADVWSLTPGDVPGRADLAWASSPCQDFSLAGARAGLAGERSSALLGFWRLMEALDAEGRAPATVVVENVTGLLTASGGRDFVALCEAMAAAGYRVGAVEADAAAFLPQSRPRVFVIATRARTAGLTTAGPMPPFHSRAVQEAHAALPEAVRAAWLWWRLPAPAKRNATLESVLAPDAEVRCWWTTAKLDRLIESMAPLHRLRLEQALARPGRTVAAAYRRTRAGSPRTEARFDGLAGCLRTPAGGSSRQIVLVVENGRVRARWLLPREAARLMGLPDSYILPEGSTAALKLLGDGVAVPVVRWLAEHLLEPLAASSFPARGGADKARGRA
jgi:DNA (cytosine-5)-methyltransferase 1